MNKKHRRVILGLVALIILSTLLFYSIATGYSFAYELFLPIVQKGEDIQVPYPIETETPGSPFDPYPIDTETPVPTMEPTPFKIYLPQIKR